jgi:hypothetical protein
MACVRRSTGLNGLSGVCALAACMERLSGDTPMPTPPPAPTTCCWRQKCQLRVVVMVPCPWTPIPGSAPTGPNPGSGVPLAAAPNQTPAWATYPLTPGTPYNLRLAGSPVGVPTFSPLPADVVRAFGLDTVAHRDFVFDFSGTGACRSNGAAEAELSAYGDAGVCSFTSQATLRFRYRWCGPQVCRDTTLPRFEVLSCRTRNVRFTVIDAESFISNDPCTESIVVLLVQQFCDCLSDVSGPAEGQPIQACATRFDAVSCAAKRVLAPCEPAS